MEGELIQAFEIPKYDLKLNDIVESDKASYAKFTKPQVISSTEPVKELDKEFKRMKVLSEKEHVDDVGMSLLKLTTFLKSYFFYFDTFFFLLKFWIEIW